MIRIALLDHLRLLYLGTTMALLAPLVEAAPMSPVEQLQVYACRATSSLLMLVGENFQDEHQARLEQDITNLQSTARSLDASSGIQLQLDMFVAELRQAASRGTTSEASSPELEPLTYSLHELLNAARSAAKEAGNTLPINVEYLAMQYLGRAYFDTAFIELERSHSYIGQDESQLITEVDAELMGLDEHRYPDLARMQTRWSFLRNALLDMNSRGRAFAPTSIDRHARALSDQWLPSATVATLP